MPFRPERADLLQSRGEPRSSNETTEGLKPRPAAFPSERCPAAPDAFVDTQPCWYDDEPSACPPQA